MEQPFDRAALVEYLRSTISELAKVPGFHGLPAPKQLFFNELVVTAMRFSGADNTITDEEVSLLWDVMQGTGVFTDSELSLSHLARLRELLERIYHEHREQYDANQVPRSVLALTSYDGRNGTQYAEEAKEMFYRFAAALTQSDSNLGQSEQEDLAAFRAALWAPSGPAPVQSENGPAR
ncbi:MAG: hypothetical protein M1132_05600 [Chloroflexi bacterium]|nr:hypothetical protein [Chloroflexota bacterium]